jgi:hypothetical protein
LVEVEVERLTAAAVRADEAAHQSAFAHRNPEQFKASVFGKRRGEAGDAAQNEERTKARDARSRSERQQEPT